MKHYTEDEIREYIESHDDGDKLDQDELLDMFRSAYGREPDDDEGRDLWSWVCNSASHS